jgi:hypothetical protein
MQHSIPAHYAQAVRCKTFASDLAMVHAAMDSARWNEAEVEEVDDAMAAIEKARGLLEDAAQRLSPGITVCDARADFARCESLRA